MTLVDMKRKAARRPTPRTVSVAIAEGDFAGWQATAKRDFRAGLLAELGSGQIERIIAALEEIIVDHNFPDSDDEVATSMADVDPYDGLLAIANEIFDAIAKLPNR